MSMPSDVDPDITEATERASLPPRPPRRGNGMNTEQVGWLAAALVAFLGITYLGPAVARYRARPTLRQKMAWRIEEARRRAQVAAGRARKRVRRLGGGSIWR